MTDADLVRLVDRLEDAAEGYLTLTQVEQAAGAELAQAIEAGLLLIDHRTQLDGQAVTLCRLNRHHPLVQALTGW